MVSTFSIFNSMVSFMVAFVDLGVSFVSFISGISFLIFVEEVVGVLVDCEEGAVVAGVLESPNDIFLGSTGFSFTFGCFKSNQ